VAGRLIATLSVIVLTAVAFGSCTSADELTPPQLPCTDGGRAGDDGVVAFDVPLRQLVRPGSTPLCEGQAVRTAGYLCFSEMYGPILFESREVAEADSWIMIGLSWWQPHSLTFPIIVDRMRGLQVPDWENGERMNGHRVRVVGVFRGEHGPWPAPGVTDDSAPARGTLVGPPFHLEFETAREAVMPATRLPACPGRVDPVYLPWGGRD
jgi:hypothetical protein